MNLKVAVENLVEELAESSRLSRGVVYADPESLAEVLTHLQRILAEEGDEATEQEIVVFHTVWRAVVRHHNRTRGPEADDELYLACGLAPVGPPLVNRERWMRACEDYAEQLFGAANKD